MSGFFAFRGFTHKVNGVLSITAWFYSVNSVNSVFSVAKCFFRFIGLMAIAN